MIALWHAIIFLYGDVRIPLKHFRVMVRNRLLACARYEFLCDDAGMML